MPANSALIAERLEQLSDKVDHLAGRIQLQPIVRIIIGVALALALVGNVWNALDRADQKHRQCVSSNGGRAAIKDAFADLYDGFITASHNSPEAVKFKRERMRSLDKRLPQKEC